MANSYYSGNTVSKSNCRIMNDSSYMAKQIFIHIRVINLQSQPWSPSDECADGEHSSVNIAIQ